MEQDIADLPSRDEFALLQRLQGTRVPIEFPPAADWTGPLRVWAERFRTPADA